jgi:hypothetical protein
MSKAQHQWLSLDYNGKELLIGTTQPELQLIYNSIQEIKDY